MNGSFGKSVHNQEYLIEYMSENVYIYKIISDIETKLLMNFKTNFPISDIHFNPLVGNIIILSFTNGVCKIYNLLKMNDKEEIKEVISFECIKNDNIITSIFNNFDPNKIASINSKNDIFIWDIRNLYFLNVINNFENINKMKWSNFNKNFLEIKSQNNVVRLLNIETQNIEAIKEVEGNLRNFLFLTENILILIKKEQIEKINLSNGSIIKENKFGIIKYSNEDLIKEYNILIIKTKNMIYFIDVISFSIIFQEEFIEALINCYFYMKKENEIELKYIDESNEINVYSFMLGKNLPKKKNINIDLSNIKNNFYDKYCSKIFKYIYLLNFEENITTEQKHIKNYMYISDIQTFFDKVIHVNIFIRKDFVTQLFNYQINDNQVINVSNDLNISTFSIMRKYIKIFQADNIKSRKSSFIEMTEEDLNNNNNFIKEFYIEIIKLLSIDNTNVKLLEIYLLFIYLYEKDLIKIFTEKYIEKYNDEVKYYSVCFSKEAYKDLFDLDKQSEKQKLFEFINNAYKLQNFDYNNHDLERLLDNLRDTNKEFPDFNQPIEYDIDNDELKWYSVKFHIFFTFMKIKLTEKNQFTLINMRKGLKMVKEKELLDNQDIINDKYMLQSVVFLITNPCPANDNSLEFFCNSLLSKGDPLDKLKKKDFIINNEKQLEYQGEKYENYKDICVENLNFKEFAKEEKYNFNYLINNYVKNQEDIKSFLKKIFKKKLFTDVCNVLYGNRELLDEGYLDEFIDKRLKFVPIRPSGTLAISDKISLNTFISTKQSEIIGTPNVKFEYLKEILNTAKYVLNSEHEVFHLSNGIPYYKNNCSVSIKTPKKQKFDGKKEGGNYFELLLFDKTFDSMNLREALFILNEENYDKSLTEFKKDFENINNNYLKIKGIFSGFNDYLKIADKTS